MFLPKNSTPQQLRVAVKAKNNRQEIITALSQGTVSRRDLIKWGLFTGAGALAWKNGLNPLVGNANAAIPTGIPSSPLFGAIKFSQPMPRFDVMQRKAVSALTPAPTVQANVTQKAVPAILGGGTGPVEGRPPGAIWAHQKYDQFAPKVAFETVAKGVETNNSYNPQVPSSLNSGIDPAAPIAPRFHPRMPIQNANSMWTYGGTAPPKLLQGRYGEPILFRQHNGLSADVRQNGGFGRHTLSTHEHNGHHGAENDGFAGAFFFPGQFYDYHWPIVHAGLNSINTTATDPRAGAPDGNGGITRLPGDWRETMSTHWFHDHAFSFTSQNSYKGIAGAFNLYSSLDRGNEAINDGVNLRLPSGKAKDWGNLDYDVNLVISDKAFDQSGQLTFDIFDFNGFLGDVMTVNFASHPYFEVERRKYRFRLLNGSVSRFLKLALSDASPMIQIANDGNLLPRPVVLTELDQQGTAERYDVVIDFSRYSAGTRVHLVNLAEHNDGRRVAKDLSIAEAVSGRSSDPCVGRLLEFRIARDAAYPDMSLVPAELIPNPDLSAIPISRTRDFEFGSGANQPSTSVTADVGKWGIKTDGGALLAADYGRVTAAPRAGTREVWNLRNNNGAADHPIHIHFEEGQILSRDGSAANVPPWERGRKDVYRLRPGGSMQITIQFRDWGGMFMEHCHNSVHEDHAMLMRWETNALGSTDLVPLPTPVPTPQGVKFQAATRLT